MKVGDVLWLFVLVESVAADLRIAATPKSAGKCNWGNTKCMHEYYNKTAGGFHKGKWYGRWIKGTSSRPVPGVSKGIGARLGPYYPRSFSWQPIPAIQLGWWEPSTFNYTGLGKLVDRRISQRPKTGLSELTGPYNRRRPAQKDANYDNFLRSNIDNEQDNRNFEDEAGMDHLPFRTWNAAESGYRYFSTQYPGRGAASSVDTLATVKPGEYRLVPLRWNNPHAAELEVNIWIFNHAGKQPIVVPIRKPTCSGEGHQNNIIKLTIPNDFIDLGSKIPGFKGCSETSSPLCVVQVYAHSVESRTYALAFPISIPGHNSALTTSSSSAIASVSKDPGLDITVLRELCLSSDDPGADISNAVPRWARLVSDVYNHAYQNSDFSPYSGQQHESISQNLQASCINKMVTGNRGELGRSILPEATYKQLKQLQALEDRIYKNYEALANNIIKAVGSKMKTTGVVDTKVVGGKASTSTTTTPPPLSPGVWTLGGATFGNISPKCVQISAKLHMRCCTKTGGPAPMGYGGYGCHAGKTFDENVKICEANGLRVCSRDELAGDVTARTGCNYDLKRLWSSTPCEGPEATPTRPPKPMPNRDGAQDIMAVLDTCFRCAEVGSMTANRLTTNTYIPSFQLPESLIAQARSTILTPSYRDLITESGQVRIYVQSLLDLLPFFSASQFHGIIYQPAMLKSTLDTKPDATEFKKMDAEGQKDGGEYASYLAKIAEAASLGCPSFCFFCKRSMGEVKVPLMKGSTATCVSGVCARCAELFNGFPNTRDFIPELTPLASSILSAGLPAGLPGVASYPDTDGSPRLGRPVNGNETALAPVIPRKWELTTPPPTGPTEAPAPTQQPSHCSWKAHAGKYATDVFGGGVTTVFNKMTSAQMKCLEFYSVGECTAVTCNKRLTNCTLHASSALGASISGEITYTYDCNHAAPSRPPEFGCARGVKSSKINYGKNPANGVEQMLEIPRTRPDDLPPSKDWAGRVKPSCRELVGTKKGLNGGIIMFAVEFCRTGRCNSCRVQCICLTYLDYFATATATAQKHATCKGCTDTGGSWRLWGEGSGCDKLAPTTALPTTPPTTMPPPTSAPTRPPNQDAPAPAPQNRRRRRNSRRRRRNSRRRRSEGASGGSRRRRRRSKESS